ncbi:MAG: hypothetical protein ACP5NC_07290 [Nitrososphaeria archaeon]
MIKNDLNYITLDNYSPKSPKLNSLHKNSPKSRKLNSTCLGRVAKRGLFMTGKKHVAFRDLPVPLEKFELHCNVLTRSGKVCGKPAIKKRGYRKSGSKIQRYECEAGHRFTVYNLFEHYDPKWVEAFIMHFLETSRIGDALESSYKQTNIKVSINEAKQVLKYIIDLLTNLELQAMDYATDRRMFEINVSELEVDEIYQQIFKKNYDGINATSKLKKQDHAWVPVILEPISHYILAADVFKTRSIKDIKTLFGEAIPLMSDYKGKIVRSDGLKSYKQVVEGLDMTLWSQSKSADYAVINRIERLNKEIRKYVRKKRAYTIDTLWYLIKLYRFNHNWFLRNADTGLTPFEYMKHYKIDSWTQIIKIAEKLAPLPTRSKNWRKNIRSISEYH